jgi:hypothetical protein
MTIIQQAWQKLPKIGQLDFAGERRFRGRIGRRFLAPFGLASYKALSYMSTMKVVATLGYDRRARKLLTPTERTAAELEIALAPTAWPVIRGTGGARKARAARGGRGKSGGVRIIYFVVSRRGVIYMIDIYAKSEKEDLTDAERREIRKLVAALEAEG